MDVARLHREALAVSESIGRVLYVIVWFLARLFITGGTILGFFALVLCFWMVVLSFLGVVS